MGFLRNVVVARERRRLKREGASKQERFAVSPIMRNALAADRALMRRWEAEGLPRWRRVLRLMLTR
ncbi:hypothetical protein [Gluconobacter aidae]|uniref:Uncharacterized protein n=1 Tax=Gluconobacter aidae TaxID=2662454 RepID=A0A7X1SPX8_9PROT|nr:hypothetical protein [Gluconobacter aidae]MQR98184.1 hypothetical protein [Gluconobacter aidae]